MATDRAVLAGGRVVETAPILLYMVGWTGDRVRGYAKGKGWALCEL
jgi:hypothetical protein